MGKESLIKIIPKPKPETPFYLNLLLWLSLALLIFLVGSFFFLKTKVSDLEQRKVEIEKEFDYSQEKKELEREVRKSSMLIKDFSNIFQKHITPSKFFEFLESVSHPKVQLVSLQLDNKLFHVSLSGRTENFRTLGEQILALRQNKSINDLKVYNLFLDREGKVNFGLSFNFSEDLIKR